MKNESFKKGSFGNEGIITFDSFIDHDIVCGFGRHYEFVGEQEH